MTEPLDVAANEMSNDESRLIRLILDRVFSSDERSLLSRSDTFQAALEKVETNEHTAQLIVLGVGLLPQLRREAGLSNPPE